MSRKIFNQIEVGAFIQKKRAELNYTQEYVAEALGISKTAVSNWENGVSMVDVKYLVPLSNLFSVKIDDILFPNLTVLDNLYTQTGELFQNMLHGKTKEKKLCNKLIEMYIQAKNNVVKLWKEYLVTFDEKILDRIVILNKFGFAFLPNE